MHSTNLLVALFIVLAGLCTTALCGRASSSVAVTMKVENQHNDVRSVIGNVIENHDNNSEEAEGEIAAAAGAKLESAEGSRSKVLDPNPENPIAEFQTNMGSFKAEIFLDRVPITASNFIDLAQSGFYSGIHFHRVIPGFMDQFGCPYAKDPRSTRAGTGGPPDGEFKNLKTGGMEKRTNGGCIEDEFISKDSNVPGSLSMANTGRPNSGGSQFFLNVARNAFLDWFSRGRSRHPVFGQVIEGYDLVVAISKVKTVDDNPVEPIKMNSITITNLPS